MQRVNLLVLKKLKRNLGVLLAKVSFLQYIGHDHNKQAFAAENISFEIKLHV